MYGAGVKTSDAVGRVNGYSNGYGSASDMEINDELPDDELDDPSDDAFDGNYDDLPMPPSPPKKVSFKSVAGSLLFPRSLME